MDRRKRLLRQFSNDFFNTVEEFAGFDQSLDSLNILTKPAVASDRRNPFADDLIGLFNPSPRLQGEQEFQPLCCTEQLHG